MTASKARLRRPTKPGERPRPAEAGTLRRGRRRREPARVLRVAEILRWADAHHKRTGRWPSSSAGPVRGESFLTWSKIDGALRRGSNGLPKCSGLSAFLVEHRSKRSKPRLPDGWSLTLGEVKSWARAHHKKTGLWPSVAGGPVQGQPAGVTWRNIASCLYCGLRGAPGGITLSKLLKRDQIPMRRIRRPRLTQNMILRWADAHYRNTGRWPTKKSGDIPESPSDAWRVIDRALYAGNRGLPGREHLSSLLGRKRGVPHRVFNHVPLKIPQILKWADAFHARKGRWPRTDDGIIEESPADTWSAVKSALHLGVRGLQGDSSLAKLLAEHRGHRNSMALKPLTRALILEWADAHHARTGKWPTRLSGPIPESDGDSWMHIDNSLAMQARSLRGKITLAGLLTTQRGSREIQHLPRLNEEIILRWARRHHRDVGQWPTHRSGPVNGEPGETWKIVNGALGKGGRGLPGDDSLLQLLLRRVGEACDDRRRVKTVRSA